MIGRTQEQSVTGRRQSTTTRSGIATSDEGYIVLTFEFHKEGQMWVGECRELGTATDGRSLEKVEEELLELVALDLNGLEEIGERERLFKERSIKIYPVQAPDQVTMNVPVNTSNRLVQARSIRMPARRRDLVPV